MSTNGAIRRITHACVQCRERKQKCGGVTSQGRCTTCQSRGIDCSFTEEALDPRYNPYLRIQSIGPRSPGENQDAQPSRSQSRSRSKPPGPNDEVRQLQAELEALREEVRRVNRAPPEAPPALVTQSGHDLSDLNDSHDFNDYSNLADTSAVSIPATGGSHLPTPHRSASAMLDVDQAQSRPTHSSQRPVSLPRATDYAISPTEPFEGPMRILHNLGADDGSDSEENDPIKRQVLTPGEARRAFSIFFEHCHLNAPFLDTLHDGNMEGVRSRSSALFLNILAVGTRFWSHKSRKDIWLHIRYPRLIKLLDDEMIRLTLKPQPRDNQLETVQAWMLYCHWMPVDSSTHRSRFSESSVWQCLGSAIRWATLLGLDRTAALPFMSSTKPNFDEVRAFRTMLYLTESDYYLALSTRKSPTLPTRSLFDALPRFLVTIGAQATDHRLAALFRVVQMVQIMGGRADSIETLEVFDEDVNAVDQEYKSLSSSHGVFYDKMSQHFPFTSLRWYRLSFASTLLPAPHQWYEGHQSLRMSIEWASQIIYHLSASASETPFQAGGMHDQPLEPDQGLVSLLSFAIDQYFMVIAYTASFLVLAWQHSAMDNQLRSPPVLSDDSVAPRSSTLFRLVDLASRTLEQCAPTGGHLATRYASFLQRLASTIAVGPAAHSLPAAGGGTDVGANFDMVDLGGAAWDGNWLTLMQTTGMTDWPFGDMDGT